MDEQSNYRGKFVHTFGSGQGERFEYLLAPVLDEYQNTEATVCIYRDITEQALAEEKTWHNAHHDLLTGLPNRRLFLWNKKSNMQSAMDGLLRYFSWTLTASRTLTIRSAMKQGVDYSAM